MNIPALFSILNLVSAYHMVKFALPKLTSAPVSVHAFTQFGEVLGIDGHNFMLLTGSLELLIAVVLLAAVVKGIKRTDWFLNSGGNLLLLGTMSGALLTEFIVRPAPIPSLVRLASALVIIAVLQLARTGYLYRTQA